MVFGLSVCIVLGGLWRATQSVKLVGLWIGWSLLLGYASFEGFFLETASKPPRLFVVIAMGIALVIVSNRSLTLGSLHLKWLLGISAVRIPIEWVLFLLYEDGMLPQMMTFHGLNFDIMSGVSACALLFIYRGKAPNLRIVLIWNWMALVLLTVIVLLAVLSAPSPVQLLNHSQPNLAVLHFPYTLLPGTVVPIVALSHVLIFRLLYHNRHAQYP